MRKKNLFTLFDVEFVLSRYADSPDLPQFSEKQNKKPMNKSR